ncbi:MAG: small multi-drug export protein [Candidatus Krumholzibacteria bacterium]|nr:small multi-drug export protein [Candidatus Krumholzibacteria bacterium]
MDFLLLTTAFSHRLWTVLIAMLPLAELRGSMPYAMFVLKMHWQEALVLSIIGNFIPVIPFLFFLERFAERLMKHPRLNRFMTWTFNRTRSKSSVIEKFEAVGLALFVGVPLPLTGAWSGCIAAFLFRIPMRDSIPAIFAGILIAGALVTLVCLGVIQGAGIFLGHWGRG